MPTKDIQQSSGNNFLSLLRVSGAALLATIGFAVALHTASQAVSFASDFLWRWSKGYLSWDMQGMMGAYLVSAALFAVMCFMLASCLYRRRWSRKIVLRIVVAGAVSFMLFVGFILLLGAGLADIERDLG